MQVVFPLLGEGDLGEGEEGVFSGEAVFGEFVLQTPQLEGGLFPVGSLVVSGQEALAAWYNQIPAAGSALHRLPGLARALPIHYASAAVCGCTLCVGFAQALLHGNESARAVAEADSPEPAAAADARSRKQQRQAARKQG